jgi:hypothetical protein
MQSILIYGNNTSAYALDIEVNFSGANTGHLLSGYPLFKWNQEDGLTYPFNLGMQRFSTPANKIRILLTYSEVNNGVSYLFNQFVWLALAGSNNSGYAVLTGSLKRYNISLPGGFVLASYDESYHYSNSKFDTNNSSSLGPWVVPSANLFQTSNVSGWNTLSLNAEMTSSDPNPAVAVNLTVTMMLEGKAYEIYHGQTGYGAKLYVNMHARLYIDGYDQGEISLPEDGMLSSSVGYPVLKGGLTVYGNFTSYEWVLTEIQYGVTAGGNYNVQDVVFYGKGDGNLLESDYREDVYGPSIEDIIDSNHPAYSKFGSYRVEIPTASTSIRLSVTIMG